MTVSIFFGSGSTAIETRGLYRHGSDELEDAPSLRLEIESVRA